MSLFKKSLLIVLVVLNAVVFIWTFAQYFQNNQVSYFYSSSSEITPDKSLNEKIKAQCGDELEKVIKDDGRGEFVCNLDREHSQQGSYYELNTRIILQKNQDDSIKILGSGAMKNKTRYALEADFCESCKEVKRTDDQDIQSVLEQVFNVAQTIQHKAKESVKKAKQVYINKDLMRRNYKIKAGLCLGQWNEADEEFVEFALEEMLHCKLTKLKGKNLLEKEKFYHSDIKTELWIQALSDNDFLLSDSLYALKTQHFPTSLSVRNSTNLIEQYVQWKTSFNDLGLVDETKSSLQKIVDDAKMLSSTNDSLTSDLNFLLQSSPYQEMANSPVSPLNNPTLTVPDTAKIPAPTVPKSVLPSNIKDQTQYLYD